MRTIRKSIFETNSSSVHSICINKGIESVQSNLKFNQVTLGIYEWGPEYLRTPRSKLSYLFTYAIERLYLESEDIKARLWSKYNDSECEPYSIEYRKFLIERLNYFIKHQGLDFEEFSEFEGFENLVYFIDDHCDHPYDFEILNDDCDFDIDHQSCEWSLNKLLDYENVSIEDLVLNDKYYIEISNDNSL